MLGDTSETIIYCSSTKHNIKQNFCFNLLPHLPACLKQYPRHWALVLRAPYWDGENCLSSRECPSKCYSIVGTLILTLSSINPCFLYQHSFRPLEYCCSIKIPFQSKPFIEAEGSLFIMSLPCLTNPPIKQRLKDNATVW